ncbi:MAG: hypothetical protein P8Y97_11910, partial [Candidatus Lokiarchaeota archaeon]
MMSNLNFENVNTAKNLEENYHWIEAAILYESNIEDYKNQDKFNLAAETAKSTAYSYFRGAQTERNFKNMLGYMNKSMNYYEEASKLFAKIEKSGGSNECRANFYFIKGLIDKNTEMIRTSFERSLQYYHKAKLIFTETKDRKKIADLMIKEIEIMKQLLLFTVSEGESSKSAKKMMLTIEDKINEGWNYSEEIEDIQTLIKLLHLESWLIFYNLFIESINSNENFQKRFEQFYNRCNDLMNNEKIEDPEVLLKLFQASGFAYIVYSVFILKLKQDYEEYLEKGLKLLDDALNQAKGLQDLFFIQEVNLFKIFGLYLSDNLHSLQNTLYEKKKEILERNILFNKINSNLLFYNNLIISLYYFLIGKQVFFTDSQRIENLKKARKYILSSENNIVFFPVKSLSHQLKAWIYKYLISLNQEKSERQNFVLELLENVDHSEENIKSLGNGFAKLNHYLTVYQTYRILSKTAENEDDKHKMLRIAIDYLERGIEMKVSPKLTQFDLKFHLAFQYRNLAEIFKENNLEKPIEILKNLSIQCSKGNFNVYCAFSLYFLAKIENQRQNYRNAAKYYNEAKKNFNKLMENIEGKEIKEKITELAGYCNGWELIERAKFHYLKNEFSISEKNFVQASNILRKLKKYNYESIYYSAWIILEKAEALSYNRKSNKAIDSFQLAQESFKNSYKSYQKMLSKPEFDEEKFAKLSFTRRRFCNIRKNIEEAREFEVNKQYTQTMDKYELVTSEIKKLCDDLKDPYDKKNYEVIYWVVESWKDLLLAEKLKNINKYSEASKSLKKCCIDHEKTLINSALIASSSFYKALSYLFKISLKEEAKRNEELFEKGKTLLKKAKVGYLKGKRESDASWTKGILNYIKGIYKLVLFQKSKEEKGDLKGLFNEAINALKNSTEIFKENKFNIMEKEVLANLKKIKKEKVFSKELLYLIKGPPISKSVELIKTPLSIKENSINFDLSTIRLLLNEEIKKEEIQERIKKYHFIYHDFLKRFNQFQWRESTIAIAQTSIDKELEKLEKYYYINGNTFRLKKEFVSEVEEKITKIVNESYKKRAKILIIPSFLIDLNYDTLLNHIINLSKKYNMIIIPGSYHSEENKQILAPIIAPQGVLWEQTKQVKSLLDLKGDDFSKNVLIKSPKSEIHIGNTECGRITIINCQDFLDEDLRNALLKFEPNPDIIVNLGFSGFTNDFKTTHIEFH